MHTIKKQCAHFLLKFLEILKQVPSTESLACRTLKRNSVLENRKLVLVEKLGYRLDISRSYR